MLDIAHIPGPGTAITLIAVIALLSALLFFFTRTDRYLVASAAITVMALTCFNLIGDGLRDLMDPKLARKR